MFCPLGSRKQRTQDYDADSGLERVACTKLSVKVQEHGSSDINEVSKYMRSSLFLKKIKLRKIKNNPVASKCQFDASLVVSVSSILPTHQRIPLGAFNHELSDFGFTANFARFGRTPAYRISERTHIQPMFSTESSN